MAREKFIRFFCVGIVAMIFFVVGPAAMCRFGQADFLYARASVAGCTGPSGNPGDYNCPGTPNALDKCELQTSGGYAWNEYDYSQVTKQAAKDYYNQHCAAAAISGNGQSTCVYTKKDGSAGSLAPGESVCGSSITDMSIWQNTAYSCEIPGSSLKAKDCINGSVCQGGSCANEQPECVQLTTDIKQIADYARQGYLDINGDNNLINGNGNCDNNGNNCEKTRQFINDLDSRYGSSLRKIIAKKASDSKYGYLFKNDSLISCSAANRPLCLGDDAPGSGINEAYTCVSGPKSCKVWDWVTGEEQKCNDKNNDGKVCKYSKDSRGQDIPLNVCDDGSTSTAHAGCAGLGKDSLCPTVGAQQCSADKRAVQTCQSKDGCNQWVDTTPCKTLTYCDSARMANGDGSYGDLMIGCGVRPAECGVMEEDTSECRYDTGKGCSDWQDKQCAKSGLKCAKGACLCDSQCTAGGSHICTAGDTKFSECQANDETGCNALVPSPCPDGEFTNANCECKSPCKYSDEWGDCVIPGKQAWIGTKTPSDCVDLKPPVLQRDCKPADKCSIGTWQCDGQYAHQPCVFNSSNNRNEWDADQPCGAGQTCSAGQCICANDPGCAYEGYQVCDPASGKDAYRVCQKTGGCLKWSSSASRCSKGAICAGAGQCTSSISGGNCSAMGIGVRRCVFQQGKALPTVAQTCGSATPGFLSWINSITCPAGTYCVLSGKYITKCMPYNTATCDIRDFERGQDHRAKMYGRRQMLLCGAAAGVRRIFDLLRR